MARVGLIDDDSLPYLNMLTGTEIFAEAFGCEVHRPVDNKPFALPLVNDASEVSKLKVPRLGSCSLDYLFEMADELCAKAGAGALLRMVDLQSPMDIANLIWEKSSLLMALYESPEAVKELAFKVQCLLTEFFDEWFRRYGTGFIAHYPDYYMEGGVTFSVDEVGVISPGMFEEFFTPELEYFSKRYGGIGVHCCADARHQWGNFKGLKGLKLINLNKPPTRQENYLTDAIKEFSPICAQLHYGWTPEGDVSTWPSQLPCGTRYVFDITAKNMEEAKELAAKFNSLRDSHGDA